MASVAQRQTAIAGARDGSGHSENLDQWRSQRWRMHDAGHTHAISWEIYDVDGNRRDLRHDQHGQHAGTGRRTVAGRHRILAGVSLIRTTVVSRHWHDVPDLISSMGHRQHPRVRMGITHRPVRHAMHRGNYKNQPRQPCHHPKVWRACEMA